MTSGKHAGILTVVAALILSGGAVLGACGAEKSARTEARALFDRISALDPNAPQATRRARVQALADLPLRAPELVQVREVCVTAHRGLLDAERAQAAARSAIEAAEREHPEGAIPADEAQRIADAISDSNRALRAAQSAMPRCEAHSRELALQAR